MLLFPPLPQTSSLASAQLFMFREKYIKLFFVAGPAEHGSSPNVNGSDEVEGKYIRIHFGLKRTFLSVCAQASYLGVEVGGGGTLSPSRSRGGEGGKGTQLWEGTNSLEDLQIFVTKQMSEKQKVDR